MVSGFQLGLWGIFLPHHLQALVLLFILNMVTYIRNFSNIDYLLLILCYLFPTNTHVHYNGLVFYDDVCSITRDDDEDRPACSISTLMDQSNNEVLLCQKRLVRDMYIQNDGMAIYAIINVYFLLKGYAI